MENAVQAAEFLVEQTGQFLEIFRAGDRQVDRCQGGFRPASGLDFIVNRFQFFLGAPQQNDRGAMGGQCECSGAADAGTGASDKNNAVFECVLGALIVEGVLLDVGHGDSCVSCAAGVMPGAECFNRRAEIRASHMCGT